MTDVTTQSPMRVSTLGGVGPYIRLPYSQIDDLKRILDKHGISYWVKENVISFDGGPEFAIVNFGRNGDANAIQAVLDSTQ